MTKIFSIVISAFVLLQSINIHFNDLLDLDELLEHYEFHNQVYGDNFLVFVSKHYGQLKTEHIQKHQEEQQEHEDLPFQQQGNSIVLVVFIPNQILEYPSQLEISLDKKRNFHYTVSYTSLWIDGPFQPPRHI